GLGELAGRAEALAHDVEERSVEVDALVARAIKRPHRGAALTAGGRVAAGVERETRRGVGLAGFLEDIGPDDFRAAQNLRDELALRVIGCGTAGLRRRRRCLRVLRATPAAAQHA